MTIRPIPYSSLPTEYSVLVDRRPVWSVDLFNVGSLYSTTY